MGKADTIFRQPPNVAGLLTQKRRLASPPPDAREIFPTPAQLFIKAWQRERMQRLARICRCIDRGRQQGKRIRKMVILHAWRWRGRHYKCDPERRIRFRASTLLRIYYQWKRGGRTQAAIALRYRSGNRKLPAGKVLELARACAQPGVRSFHQAYGQVANPRATVSAFWHAMPAQVRERLAALCAARRKTEYLEREAARAIARVENDHRSLAT